MHHHLRQRLVLHQPRHATGTGHGMPLIADAPGIEPQRVARVGPRLRQRRRNSNHIQPAAAPACPGFQQARRALRLFDRYRPLHRRERVIRLAGERGQRADIKRPRAVVLKARQRRVLAENLVRMLPAERLAKAQPARHLRDYPPVRARLAGRRQKRPLARDPPL